MRFLVLSPETERELCATLRSVRELADRVRMLEPLLLSRMMGGDSGGSSGLGALLSRFLQPPPSPSPASGT